MGWYLLAIGVMAVFAAGLARAAGRADEAAEWAWLRDQRRLGSRGGSCTALRPQENSSRSNGKPTAKQRESNGQAEDGWWESWTDFGGEG